MLNREQRENMQNEFDRSEALAFMKTLAGACGIELDFSIEARNKFKFKVIQELFVQHIQLQRRVDELEEKIAENNKNLEEHERMYEHTSSGYMW